MIFFLALSDLRGCRAELHYQPNATQMHLSIKRLAVVDEAMYKCEITYNEVKDGCSVVQFINLTTMSKYAVRSTPCAVRSTAPPPSEPLFQR